LKLKISFRSSVFRNLVKIQSGPATVSGEQALLKPLALLGRQKQAIIHESGY